MKKFAIGNRAKLEKRGVFNANIFSTELELVSKSNASSNDLLVIEDDYAPEPLLKSYAEATGAKIVKASSQLPVDAGTEELIKRQLQTGESVSKIAKVFDVPETELALLKMRMI